MSHKDKSDYETFKPFNIAAPSKGLMIPANGSQAVHKGSNAYVRKSQATAIVDSARFQGDAVDFGAYEFAPSNVSATSILDGIFAQDFEKEPSDDEF